MITISNIDANAMNVMEKQIAIDMKLIAINDEKKKSFFTNVITEEKLSYLRLIFDDKFRISELEEEKINKLLSGYYINFKLIDENDEIYYVFYKAIKQRCSDIHIEPYEEYANIRYRVDGTLVIVNKINLRLYNKLINRIKVLANLDISKKLEPQDGKVKFSFEDKNYDMRVSILPTIKGEKIVLRILYQNKELINLNNLTFNKKQRKIIDKLLSLNNGIVLVNGPTGSGKSTTLYAFVNYYDKECKNISTVEDPVEFNIPGIIQSNVNEKIGFSFSVGLRHLLRQDPDIILIGEIRDEETAKIAVRAAITGHKVLATIHTNSARDVYFRLMETGVKNKILYI